ncbi:MAG: TIGR00303 family protein [Synergistaceae bacterium]|jgi:uncharacterized protein (TIGR00303 family)|nr:TIGR00303 family protein [Synergistaceae bacterium]
MFFLFISGTEIAQIPGMTVAGANREALPFTAPADADVIRFGHPAAVNCFPMDPDGHPTPAIITRAAALEAKFSVCVIRAGSYLPPEPPYVEIGAPSGNDPRFSAAVPDAAKIFERAKYLAQTLSPSIKTAMLAESIPGGTTTALLVLRALGFDAMVSSGGNINPVGLKNKIWDEASARAGIKFGCLKDDPLRAIKEMGDPMQSAVLGFILGSNNKTEIILAGGTQMLVIAACAKALGISRKITVATTSYVARDSSSSFEELARELGVDTYVAPLDFSDSPHKGLRDYEKGYVKEGAGAGGSVLYASRNGVGVREIIDRTDAIYQEISEYRTN